MKMKWGIAALAVCASAGCINPRSVVLGQTPRMLTPGDVEVGLSTGIAWDSFANANGGSGNATVQVPATEANIAMGFGDFDLNLHASSAGLQPGVKIPLPDSGRFKMALLPSLAGGFYAGRSYANGNSSPFNAWTAQGGLRFLAAIPLGVYASVGYDFQLFRVSSGQTGTGTTPSGLTSHHVNLALGYELSMGQLRLRPEFALSYSPAVFTEGQTGDPGTELMVFPNLTIAFAAPTGGTR